jgi:hypothetical protein
VTDRQPRAVSNGDKGGKGEGRREETIPELEDMCEEAPVSRNHSLELGGLVATPALLRAA